MLENFVFYIFRVVKFSYLLFFIVVGGFCFAGVEYKAIRPAVEGLYAVMVGKSWGFVKDGKIFIETKYDMVSDFNGFGFALAKKNGEFFFVRKDGKEKPIHGVDVIFPSKRPVFVFQKGKKYGFINAENGFKVEAIYEFMTDFHDGFAWVRKNSKWGMIDERGVFKINLLFDSVHENGFMNGQSIVFVRKNRDDILSAIAYVIDVNGAVVFGK